MKLKTILSFVLTIIIFTSISFAQDKVYEKPDKMPMPEGGIMSIMEKVVYPKSAKVNKIEGKVVVKAVVDESGNVIKTEVVESVNEDLDKAAVKAIKESKFIPGEKDGKKVKVEIFIPVKFKLG